MRWGSDLIMFGTARDDHYGHRIGQGWRDFGVRDLEGNQWNFGTYEPT